MHARAAARPGGPRRHADEPAVRRPRRRRRSGKLSGLWSVAAAFFEAQAQGRLSADVYSKRLTSRLLAQVRLAERGQADVSDRLTQDLLFFCARALPGDDAKAPRLVAVRKAFALGRAGAGRLRTGSARAATTRR